MSATRWPSWLKTYLARYKREVAVALGLGLTASACAALLMFTSGYLISATALASTTLFSVMVPVACVQLFGLGRPLARYAERLASHDWVLRLTSDLRLALYRSIEARISDPALERAAGEYLGLLSDDVAHLQNLYLRVIFPSVVAYLLAVLASILFGFFSWAFAGIMLLALAVVTVLLPWATLLATRAGMHLSKQWVADETVSLADDVYGSIDWILAGRTDQVLSSHTTADARIREAQAASRMRQRGFSLASTLLLSAVLFAIIAWSGDTLGASHATANWIAAFALGFFPLIEAFAVLPVSFSESVTHKDSIQRLDEYLEKPSSTPSPPVHPESVDHAIRVEHLCYTYPSAARPALQDITVDFKRFTNTAVLGRSGSGKSTLVKLICGDFAPTSGAIAVSGEVGYLGQQPYLFNRTLRENLALADPDIPDERLTASLESVGLGSLLESLPHGLDTVVGETGVGFSGGEAHRIALARVLAADTPIVIVDEPFSALDPETEQALIDTLLRVCADKTLIVVTHHLAQIERFDRVIFIEDARIALDGSPADLSATSSRFRTLLAFDRA